LEENTLALDFMQLWKMMIQNPRGATALHMNSAIALFKPSIYQSSFQKWVSIVLRHLRFAMDPYTLVVWTYSI
jgi:hypothetical protein